MQHPGFFERAGPFAISVLAQKTAADPAPSTDPQLAISDVKPLNEAGEGHVSFLDNRKFVPQLGATRASAVFVAPALAARVPAATVALVTKTPYREFALALQLFYPAAMQSRVAMAAVGEPSVHPTARIDAGVVIEPGAVVGREAEIGRGTIIAAGAVIGYRVRLGKDGFVGPGATITHAILGDRVIVHAGVRIGQDGFGFAMGADGHLKVPQIGCVIIKDDVEIGANTAIDRGALKDTIIGEGTKIDNLVQIGHNVVIGRHCVIVAQTGISGSVELGDFVVMGGQSGVVGHIKIGSGAQLGGASHAKSDIPAGSRLVGTPAVPIKDFARQLAVLKRLAARTSVSDED
jgi:UDP-3-O-[3-hydroxymyristoyl] glucosamine N-acyltransferase